MSKEKRELKCTKCGSIVSRKDEYCGSCGEKLVIPPRFKSMKRVRITVFVLLMMVFVVVAYYLYEKNRRVVIELNQFVEVEYEGYDTHGTAICTINWGELQEKYCDKLNEILPEGQSMQMLMKYMETRVIGGALTEDSRLSTNQEIRFVWDCENEDVLEETYKVVLKYEDIPFVVTGLEENRRIIIELNQFVEVEYEGYDTIGTATSVFRWDKLEEKYHEELNGILYGEQSLQELMEFLETSVVGGTLSEDSKLTNKQQIHYVWDCYNEEALEETYRIVLSYENVPFVVSGLEDVQYVNLFDDITVDVHGIEPYGSATLRGDTGIYNNSFRFEMSNNSELSNGDVVTVNIQYADGITEESLIETYGIKVTELSKQFEISGLSKYVSQIDEIPEDIMDAIIKQGKDVYTAYAANWWIEGAELEDMIYQGCYLLNAKESDLRNQNKLYPVYKVVASDNFPKSGVYGTFEYYVAIEFAKIIKQYDEQTPIKVDLEDCNFVDCIYEREVVIGFHSWTTTLKYIGCQDMDTIFKYVVATQVDKYKYNSKFVDGVTYEKAK